VAARWLIGVFAAVQVTASASAFSGDGHRPIRNRSSPLTLTATACCQRGRTASGELARPGLVAADPRVLPVGTVVRVLSPPAWVGRYTVMDTGARVRGRRLDIFVESCRRARLFGRRPVRVLVVDAR
jgi:3D (Asp-Asp-Asp) domain-containing protein